MPTEDAYRRLQQHLDRGPAPFPATESGVELRILKRLFSEEQARIALELSAIPEPIHIVQRRLPSLSGEELRRKLGGMAEEGLILATEAGGEIRYAKLAFVVGIYERQVGRLTPELERDVRTYEEEAFGAAMHALKTPQMRTVPVGKSIPVERNVATYEDIRSFAARSEGPFAAMPCICRKGKDLLEEPCQQTKLRENCLTFGMAAKAMVEAGPARYISREEMIEFLEAADREGLVLQPENTANPLFVCCCCGCCCSVLTTAKRLPKPAQYFGTNYYAESNGETCEGCGTCLTRCQMDAVAMDSGHAKVERDRCIGCGLCVTTCPSTSLRLRRNDREKAPPKDTQALYMQLMRDRYGPLKMAGALTGYLLGRKF